LLFCLQVKEKADPSGKRRLRDDKLTVFPQAVQPLKNRLCGLNEAHAKKKRPAKTPGAKDPNF